MEALPEKEEKTMKKALFLPVLILALLFSFAARGSAAEHSIPVPVSLNLQDNATSESFQRVQYGRQTVYVPVTLIYEQLDGSTVTSTIYPGVAEVIYKYYVYYAHETGNPTGGCSVLDELYPALRPIGDTYLGIAVAREKHPVQTVVRWLGNQFDISIKGGTFTITYNATVRYNAEGQIIATTPTTVTRVYNYTATGS